MDEGIAMDHLNRRSGTPDAIPLDAEQPRGLDG